MIFRILKFPSKHLLKFVCQHTFLLTPLPNEQRPAWNVHSYASWLCNVHSEYTRLARTEIYCHSPMVVAVANQNAVLAYCQWQQTTWIIKLAVRAMLPAVAAKQPLLV